MGILDIFTTNAPANVNKSARQGAHSSSYANPYANVYQTATPYQNQPQYGAQFHPVGYQTNQYGNQIPINNQCMPNYYSTTPCYQGF